MRRAITQRVASFITQVLACHQPFQPRKPGEYIVRKCYECGHVVLADEVGVGSLPFVLTVGKPKERT